MDIVIVANFTGDFSKNDNNRFLYLAKKLCADHKVEIVTSDFFHTKKRRRRKTNMDWPFKVTFISEPGYSKNICFRRFLSHLIWGKNLIKYINGRSMPDVIYCAVPSLMGPYLVAKFCEKKRIRFVIDIQDLWPEAFQMIINIPIICDILFAPFRLLANGIYKRADLICAVSDSYCRRAKVVNHKCLSPKTVYLGTELVSFDRFVKETPITEKKDDEIWIAYCGTLGSSYDIICAIDALLILNISSVKLIVMGDGPKREEFENYARIKDANVIFTGVLQYNKMCSLLNVCDIALNPIAHGAMQSIINKHADYAAAGIPVVSSQESKEYRNMVNNYKMGFNCKNGDPYDMARQIKRLIDDDVLAYKMGNNARKCAEELFDRGFTYRELTSAIVREFE